MATDLVTEAQALAWINDSSIMSGDPVFDATIDAASDAIMGVLGYNPVQQEYTDVASGWGSYDLPLKYRNITACSAIAVVSPPCIGFGAYGLPPSPPTPMDPTQVTFGTFPQDMILRWTYGKWPKGPQGFKNIAYTVTAGWASLPPAIMTATLMTIKALWYGAMADQNATGEQYSGVMSQQFRAGGPGSVPPQARLILDRYTLPTFPS